jgi:dTDP-glucose pyrophosphorylase/CBS domain-containing protein
MTHLTATTDLEDLIVAPDAPILEVLKVIDRSGLAVAMVCDARHRLLAVASDGDIRRHLIRGGGIEAPISQACTRDFVRIASDIPRAEAVNIMLAKGITCLPVLDKEGCLIDLHTLRIALLGKRCDSWAMIMAGGKGERLGELTSAIPKPMLPIGDRPILEWIVQLLVGHGIRRIFISVNYLNSMIEDHFGDGSRLQCRIDYVREREPLGTGGPLALLPETPQAPVVVMNGDLLTAINITRLLAFHRAGSFAATMALREHTVRVPFGVAELDGVRVARLVEKPSLQYRINAGIYVLNPAVVGRVPKGTMFPITTLLEGCMQDGLAVGAYHMQEAWNDIGLPDEYARAHAGAE